MNYLSRLSLSFLIALGCSSAYAQEDKLQRAAPTQIQKSKTTLEALVQIGPDSEAWRTSLVNTDIVPVQFRWRTEYGAVGEVEWEIGEDPQDWKVIARGDANASYDKKQGNFTVDLREIVGNKSHRPLQYFVRIVTYALQRKATQNPSNNINRIGEKKQKALKRAPSTPIRPIKKRVKRGVPSPPLSMTYVSPGDMTTFSSHGFTPELLISMPIEIKLDTLTIKGEGGDEDPYLLVVAVFADGTTVIPELDFANLLVRFTNSTVRLQSHSKTHENVAGADVDVGVPFDIPEDIGRYRATIRPIGAQLMNSVPLTADQLQSLREATNVAIVVVGMEEDAVPSTEAMNEVRGEMVSILQQELDRLVQGVAVNMLNPTNIPDLTVAALDIADSLEERLEKLANARGEEEFVHNFKFLGFPTVILVGGLNPDDYIGSRVAFFTYEELLNAGPQGIPISLQLNQSWEGLPRYLQRDTTESIWYLVEGRIRLRL